MYKLCALNLHVFPCTKTMFHGLTVNVHTCIHCLYVQLYFSSMYLVHVCVHYVFLFVVITCFASKGHHISSCNIWWAIFLIGVAMSYMYNDFWSPWFPFPSALNNRKHFMRRDKMSGTVQCFCFHENKWTTLLLSLWKKMSYFWISHLKPFTPDDKYV